MTITALPTPPNRATDSAITFSTKADALLSALPQFVTETNASGVATTASQSAAAASAVTASGYVTTTAANAASAAQSVTDAAYQASLAAASANMKGNWSSLTGALNKPASVVDGGKIWALLNNLANVTLSQPGVTGDWQDISPSQSAYACLQDQAVVALTSSATNTTVASIVTVDSSRTLLILSSAVAVHAVCYDKTSKSYGSAVLIRTTTGNSSPKAILVGVDKILVGSCQASTSAFESVVLSLTGTTISVASPVATTLPENAASSNSIVDVVSSSGSFIFSINAASNARVLAITVSGTTPTPGTSLVVLASGTTSALRVASSGVLMWFGAASPNIVAQPISVSGTTLTLGTSASATGSVIVTAASLSTGRWALVFSNTHTRGAIVSLSGTTATMTTVALGSGASLLSCGVKVGDQIIVASEATYVNVLTDVSGTATAGTPVSAYVNPTAGSSAPCGYGADYAAFIIPGAQTMSYSIIKISSNNPYIYDSSSTIIGRVSAAGQAGMSGAPSSVLSISGKSVVAVPNQDGGAATMNGVALQFGSTLRQVLLPAVPNNPMKQSDSVLWTGTGVGTNIRIHRLELV